MSLSEPEKTPDLPSSPVARKQSDSYALPVTPSPTKDCGSKCPSIDNEPFSHDWKTSCTTPTTKVTDDPFIDDRKPSVTLLVRIGDTKTYDKTLIPVTTKMIHSAVSENNHFFLKDGRQLHLVKGFFRNRTIPLRMACPIYSWGYETSTRLPAAFFFMRTKKRVHVFSPYGI